ncbi:MAG: hypothetical protein IID13_07060 [Candidatus Marinimicrobia bacterium]|nr:hypothetical protein [Candidatus Neomarinimicrobiota bacterium]
MSRVRRRGPSLVAALAVLVGSASGQQWYNHPELDWQTFETEHFLIHFHQGTERSAREAATVAEKVYGPITRMYNFEPAAKTHLIIKDVDDDSNGLAYFYDNKIEIWARPLDYDLRGSHRWMQGVITHEFVHIIQLATSMKFSHRVPGLYLQWIDYEDEKREDVLYGYPNVLVSYAYPGVNIPPWFAEGVAEFMYPGANYDYWDSHRDMLLRDRVLGHNLLSLAGMSSFGKRGIGNESAYNQGFAFVTYLAERFGPQVLEKVAREMSTPWAVSMNRALRRATGVSGKQLYRDWSAELEESYFQRMQAVLDNPVTGEVLVKEGTANLHPVWRPGRRSFAYLSNREADYFSQTNLYLYDLATGESEKLADGVRSAPCWSVDGERIYYAARGEPDKTGARWLDLYVYDLEEESEERLTHGRRVTSPILVGADSLMAYLTVYDGTSNIRLLDLATGADSALTNFSDGIYLFSLTWDQSANLLICDANTNHGRELLAVALSDGEARPYLPRWPVLAADAREPDQSAGGLVLGSDASGIFNLYLLGADGREGYITNTTGGAFMPSMSADGEVLYSLYADGGYKIAHLPEPQLLDEQAVGYAPDYWRRWPTSPLETGDGALVARDYVETMSRPFILPRLMVDYGTVKPGFYFYANEVINRLFMFGGASINRLRDTDYFLIFEFSRLKPTLYAEIYTVQRHVSQGFDYYAYRGTNNLRFNLLEGVVGGRLPLGLHRFWLEASHSRYRETVYPEVEGLSYPSFSFDYFIGSSLTARWRYSARPPEYGGNMFPTKGYELGLELRAEKNDLVGGFGINEDYGTLEPKFVANNTVKLLLNFRRNFALHRRNKIGATYQVNLGWLSNQKVDDFFYFFGGGLPGLRGSTYYDSTAQGPNLMIQTLSLRVPVLLERHIPLAQLIVQNASLGGILQLGDAFSGSWLENRYRWSAGLELRLSGYSFYVFPFALSYEIHTMLEGDQGNYRHYFSLLFDFQ